MAEWYIWVIFLLAAFVLFCGGAGWLFYANKRDSHGKINVLMRSLAGERDEFLAVVQEGFVIMPPKKRKYLEYVAQEYGISKDHTAISDIYLYDVNSTIRDYYPSPKGWLSFLSAPIETIEYNEGDPMPLPRTKLDKDGNLVRPRQIDSATAIALAQDRKYAASLRLVGEEMERERRKVFQLASKIVPAIVHYAILIILIGAIGVTVWGAFYIVTEIHKIQDGLGI